MRAVYYARVSTDEEIQLNALESQIKECEKCIISNNWVNVGSYIDEGKSGTTTKGREAYNMLFDDLSSDKFDVIVIKSQDRLQRNVKDWYVFVDALVKNEKKLYMYIENKFYTPDDALITGIRSILAEDYSRELSKKINNAHKNRQKYGENIVITSKTWGYDKINKQVVINEKEAEIVTLMYELCCQGYGTRSISKELSNRGIYSRSGAVFSEGTIRKIIQNPLYKGVAVMNKSHYDFNTKKTVRNPESEWIHREDAVEPIVSNELWEEANRQIKSRSKEVKGDEFSKRRIGINKGKSDLSGKIVCGECGSPYWRRYRKLRDGTQVVDFSCSEYIQRGRKNKRDTRGVIKIKADGGCDNVHIREDKLMMVLQDVADDVFVNKRSAIIEKGVQAITNVFNQKTLMKERTEVLDKRKKILSKKEKLLNKLLDDVITNEDYKTMASKFDSDLLELESRMEVIEKNELSLLNTGAKIEELKKFLNEHANSSTRLTELLKHIEFIRVYEDSITVKLDFYKNIIIDMNDIQTKKCQYVDQSIYSLPQTDTFDRKNRKFKICLQA